MRADAPSASSGLRSVREERAPGPLPIYRHPEWQERFPWLFQGTTGRGEGEPFDLGLFGSGAVGRVLDRWRELRRGVGFAGTAHSRQVHGARIRRHEHAAPGLLIGEGDDGHETATGGLLLTISVADCVPIFLVEEGRRRVLLLHGGWRGVVAGILERGLERVRAADCWLHVGPAICGTCYEVGPEVHEALGRAAPAAAEPVDLRAELARRAIEAGVRPERITISEWCTRCGGSVFFSHRGGRAERQLGLLGLRPDGG